jgi:hypothetical protein
MKVYGVSMMTPVYLTLRHYGQEGGPEGDQAAAHEHGLQFSRKESDPLTHGRGGARRRRHPWPRSGFPGLIRSRRLLNNKTGKRKENMYPFRAGTKPESRSNRTSRPREYRRLWKE